MAVTTDLHFMNHQVPQFYWKKAIYVLDGLRFWYSKLNFFSVSYPFKCVWCIDRKRLENYTFYIQHVHHMREAECHLWEQLHYWNHTFIIIVEILYYSHIKPTSCAVLECHQMKWFAYQCADLCGRRAWNTCRKTNFEM